jgi:hypothetical protein
MKKLALITVSLIIAVSIGWHFITMYMYQSRFRNVTNIVQKGNNYYFEFSKGSKLKVAENNKFLFDNIEKGFENSQDTEFIKCSLSEIKRDLSVSEASVRVSKGTIIFKLKDSSNPLLPNNVSISRTNNNLEISLPSKESKDSFYIDGVTIEVLDIKTSEDQIEVKLEGNSVKIDLSNFDNQNVDSLIPIIYNKIRERYNINGFDLVEESEEEFTNETKTSET